MDEQEQLARARRKLIIVGVSCMSIVIGVLWLINLQRTLIYNRLRYSSALSPFRLEANSPKQVQEGWTEFRKRINYLKPD